MASYTTYEKPIDLYSDCQNYFIGIIENNPDKDYIVFRSGYSSNTLVIGRFKFEDNTFTGVAEQTFTYSGYITSDNFNLVKGGVDNDFTLEQTVRTFAFSNLSRETSTLQGVEMSSKIYPQLTLISGIFFVGCLFYALMRHRSRRRISFSK